MRRAILIAAVLVGAISVTRANQTIYPALTRKTMVGVWEALPVVGYKPFVVHIVISPDDHDSYLSEMYPHTMTGRVFRMDSCTFDGEGKVKLHFRSLEPGDDSGIWIEGEGFGDEQDASILGKWGTDLNSLGQGPPIFLEKGTWIRGVGEASARAAEKLKTIRDGEK